MGFLKSLFGRPVPDAEEPERSETAKTSDHPNAPDVNLPDFGTPERNRWQVPEGIVVLNGKSWNELRTVHIESHFTNVELRERAGKDANGTSRRSAWTSREIGSWHSRTTRESAS